MTIEEKLKDLPSDSGVYIMYDSSGTVIYVGKAVVLKNRVRQYFNNSPKHVKVAAMVSKIADFRYIITLSEKDALALENNLIKKYQPRYNILLKDDKTSPFIRIDMREQFPTIEVTRKLKRDGARYFGPYLNGLRVWDIVGIIRTAYNMRTCPRRFAGKRACLNYHIGLCRAPCAGQISREEYALIVDKVVDFLGGNDKQATEIITAKMQSAVEREDFERAIQYREQLKMLQMLKSRDVASLGKVMDIDTLYIASNGVYSVASVNIVRGGKMMGVKNYVLEDSGQDLDEVITGFVTQYYSLGNELPRELCLQTELKSNALEEYLDSLARHKVDVTFPKKAARAKLLSMAEANARDYLDKSSERRRREYDMTEGAALRLAELIGVESCRRIECYDISHISGTDKVASQVVFIDGKPAKSQYRRYKIKTVEGNNDFDCMREVISRRIARADAGDDKFAELADLIIIDGGKGQLSSALESMHALGHRIDMIGLAKREEEIYLPDRSDPIVLSKTDYALKLVQRVRDEAHRFAITFHRNLRAKRQTASELDNIKGVGAKRKAILRERFHTMDELRNATMDELTSISGIDERTAYNIRQYFGGNDEVQVDN